jgi:hypothetical protein
MAKVESCEHRDDCAEVKRILAERDKLRRLIVAAAAVIGMSRPWSEQKAQIDRLRAEAARIKARAK